MFDKNSSASMQQTEGDVIEKQMLKDLAEKICGELHMKLTYANNLIEFEGYFAKTIREITGRLSENLTEIDFLVGQAMSRAIGPQEPQPSTYEARGDLPF